MDQNRASRYARGMNSVAVLAMIGFVAGWLVLGSGFALYDPPAMLAVLVLATVAAYLYVPWVRLRAGAYERPSWPARFWTNAAFLAVCLAAALAFAWMLARRFGAA